MLSKQWTWISSLAVLAAQAACTHPRPFEGRWVYDLPDRATGRNIASLKCPAPGPSLILPQLGDITFRSTGAHTLEGKTDQGCTWQFTVEGETAQLSPPGQSCHNTTFDTDYTINRWVLSADEQGAGAGEQLTATSHQPGMECDFELQQGRRTFVADDGATATAAPFTGTWVYSPPDQRTGANVSQVVCPSKQDGPPSVSYAPVFGSYAITQKTAQRLEARGDDGCAWTLEAHAGTAQLEPPVQTCTRNDGVHETRTHWTIATDGQRQMEILRAERTDAAGACVVIIASGERSKAP